MDYNVEIKLSSDQAHSVTVNVLSEYLYGIILDPLSENDKHIENALRLVLREFMNNDEWIAFINRQHTLFENCMDTNLHPYAG